MRAITIVFSAEQAAAALWTYGEDGFVEKALALTESELRKLWALAGGHWRVDHDLPLQSRLASDKVIAFTCNEYFEGRLRPLAQERRRSANCRPEPLRNPPPFQGSVR